MQERGQALTTDQVAERLGLTADTIRAYCAEGVLPAVNVAPGKRAIWRVYEGDLGAWLAGRGNAGVDGLRWQMLLGKLREGGVTNVELTELADAILAAYAADVPVGVMARALEWLAQGRAVDDQPGE